MKLILTHEVTNLGAPGDIVEVKDGYGRNFLLPRGFAIRWTKGGEKQSTRSRRARARTRGPRPRRGPGASRASSRPARSTCRSAPVRAAACSAPSRSPTSPTRSRAPGRQVDKRRIEVGNPIKSLGSHQVTVKVHDDIDATVNLNVVSG